jgi:hypothetical protein
VTQTERVLAALTRAGAHGITAVDFLRFPTVDGGPPITRVAARIEELRDQGHPISSGERRNKCVVYRLESEGQLTLGEAA